MNQPLRASFFVAISIAALGSGLLYADTFPGCLPVAPQAAAHPGIWVPFQLLPTNHPVIAVRADATAVSRGVVIPDRAALCRASSGSRRLAKVDAAYAATLNKWLGGNAPVILQSMSGMLVAAADPLAGALLEVFSTALNEAHGDPEFRVRVDDEIWRVDLAARESGRPVYIVYTLLFDPFRNSYWLMNENRTPIDVAKADESAGHKGDDPEEE